MARETCAAAELFASGASGDHTGVFPRAWRVAHLRACGEATSASLCSPASLYARAATLRADIADADAATIGTDDPTNEEWVRVVERAGEWRARETEAWRRAALATASPRVARALAAAMAGDETSDRAVVAAVDTRRERRDGEYADENVLDDADDDDEFGDAKTHDVIGLVRALRRRRFASARAGRRDDAAETADRLVAVVVAALGDDHPECGAAKLEAAELASAAAAATAGGTRTDTNGSATGSPLDDVSAYASASAWARPAYDFAEAFYGARSLPAARAAWCVAEALRLVSGAASARPMFAQALGAASAVLGPRHPGVGAMMIAVGERSRVEGRLEEADALLRDGFATAEAEADAAAREEEWAVAAGIAAIVPAKGQSGGEESKEGGGEEFHHSTIEPHHSEPHPAIVAAATSATAAAERRSRLADASTARAANAVARARTDAGDARAAETFRRLALAAAERAMGPAHPSVASTLGALGACAVVRRRFEDADAYFRHAVGVDERAARAGRARGRDARSGFKHPRVASHLASLASTRRDRGRLAEAEALYCAAMEAWETRDRSARRGWTNPPRDEIDRRRRRRPPTFTFSTRARHSTRPVCRVKTKAGGRRRRSVSNARWRTAPLECAPPNAPGTRARGATRRRRRPRVCVTSARFARVRVAWATPPPRSIAR